jgi:hypothetical protein
MNSVGFAETLSVKERQSKPPPTKASEAQTPEEEAAPLSSWGQNWTLRSVSSAAR